MVERVAPSTPDASRRMRRVRQKDTIDETVLRRELFASGLRYRIQFPVLKSPRRVADVAFPGRKIAVFVDGCFWHGCPEHGTWPKQNAEFWRQKIEANRRRDADTVDRLRSLGWTVLRFWSHESPVNAAKTVLRVVAKADAKHQASSSGANEKN